MNPTTDRFTVRAVVLGLILIAVAIVIALVVVLMTVSLSADQKTQIVTTLQSLGVGALGAVAGILAHTASSDPAPVPPTQALPVPLPQPPAEVAPAVEVAQAA